MPVGVTQALITGYALIPHGGVPAKLVIFAVLAVVELAVVVPALGRAADAAFGAGEAVTSAQQSTATAASTVALILVITAASLGGSNPAAHAGA